MLFSKLKKIIIFLVLKLFFSILRIFVNDYKNYSLKYAYSTIFRIFKNIIIVIIIIIIIIIIVIIIPLSKFADCLENFY